MRNLLVISALIFSFAGVIDAAQSKAESEVAMAFEKYFDARENQDWDTVAAMESKWSVRSIKYLLSRIR